MAALPATPIEPSPEPAPLSEGERLIDVCVAPSKTFTDLRRNSSWWAPWLVISVFSIAFLLVVGKQIGYEQIARNQISQSARADQFDKLPAERQAKQIHVAAAVIQYIGYAFPLIVLISFAIIAGILIAAFNLGAGAAVRYGTAMAIVAYSSLPGIIHATLSMIVMFAGVDHEGFNLQTPIASTPATHEPQRQQISIWHGVGAGYLHDLDHRAHGHWLRLQQQSQTLDVDYPHRGLVSHLQIGGVRYRGRILLTNGSTNGG